MCLSSLNHFHQTHLHSLRAAQPNKEIRESRKPIIRFDKQNGKQRMMLKEREKQVRSKCASKRSDPLFFLCIIPPYFFFASLWLLVLQNKLLMQRVYAIMHESREPGSSEYAPGYRMNHQMIPIIDCYPTTLQVRIRSL